MSGKFGARAGGRIGGVSIVPILTRVFHFLAVGLALDFLGLRNDAAAVCGGRDKDVVCTGK